MQFLIFNFMEGERYNTKILSGNLILLEKGKISSGEFLILVIFTIEGSILNVPALLVNLAKQDAWISYILTTLVSCPIPFKNDSDKMISFY
ncbi:hypothetical protein J2Y73_003356 [Peribacillus frigoritolerans]|nr:hypothetical protein [Peribacillus frigoritolerans]